MELGALLEPGRTPKTDKSALLVDAVRMVTHLRGEAEKLKDSNLNLQEKIKELKASICYILPIVILLCLLSTPKNNLMTRKAKTSPYYTVPRLKYALTCVGREK